MKKIIGQGIGIVGAWLWEKGGWTGEEDYEDLNVVGKLGYNMFCTGLKLMGVTIEDLMNIANQQLATQKES